MTPALFTCDRCEAEFDDGIDAGRHECPPSRPNRLLGTTMRPSDTPFVRRLSNLERAFRRHDPQGRNRAASSDALAWRLAQLRASVLTDDDVCDLLDNNPRLAKRWNNMERRMFGLPVAP